MKTTRKEKVKKEEKKRREEKKVQSGIEPGIFVVPSQSFTARPRGIHTLKGRNFITKNLRILLNVNSKIFFRRMTAVWTVKTQRKCISSHLHVENGSSTV